MTLLLKSLRCESVPEDYTGEQYSHQGRFFFNISGYNLLSQQVRYKASRVLMSVIIKALRHSFSATVLQVPNDGNKSRIWEVDDDSFLYLAANLLLHISISLAEIS